jgi:virginiamycin B lyase
MSADLGTRLALVLAAAILLDACSPDASARAPSIPAAEYSVPTNGSRPNGIAVGPDGNLWFTEFDGNKVAKVTTSGIFNEYPIPTSDSEPGFIAAGPDGDMWLSGAARWRG